MKMNRISKKIRENCDCDSGCGKCNSKINRCFKYYKSDIPIDYWDKSFKNFDSNKILKSKIKPYISDIDSFYDDGTSILMVGTLGTGKTYMASSMLKMAITKGYSSKYINMVDIISSIISNNSVNSGEFIEKIINYDFLVIDEIDARWIFPSEKSEQIFGCYMEHILRSRFQNKMPTILCSNTLEISKIFSGDFSKSFKSLINHYVDTIVVAGKDYRSIK